MRIIFATNNDNKVKEVKDILKTNVFSLSDLNIKINPKEDGKTYKENAFIKVNALKNYFDENNLWEENDLLIADDSGLAIDFFDGGPGIFSSRFMNDLSNEERNKKIIEMMKDSKNREAKFTCLICAFYRNEFFYFKGEIKGKISKELKGINGFGYDPIFFIEEKNKTFSELSKEEKNEISHRAIALNKLKKFLGDRNG